MYFKKSEDIARKALETGLDIGDVRKVDAFLARRNLERFTLFSAASNTGLGNRSERMLNQYTQKGILGAPKPRYLCPVHSHDLKTVNDHEGRCVDCGKTYLVEECEREMVYERLQDPCRWSDAQSESSYAPPSTRERSFLKDRRLHIAVFAGILSALIIVIGGRFLDELLITSSEDSSNAEISLTAPALNVTDIFDGASSQLPEPSTTVTFSKTAIAKTIIPPA